MTVRFRLHVEERGLAALLWWANVLIWSAHTVFVLSWWLR